MKRALILMASLLAWSSADVEAQRPTRDIEAVELYSAVLRDMPPITEGRTAAVDPRLATSFSRGAHPIDVWERHHTSAPESPVVRQLHQRVQGITYCPEKALRNSCLKTTKVVHVTFSAPIIEESAATVEATFVTRTSDERDSFDIQTWRYSFVMGPQGLVAEGRELQGRGHGSIGGKKN